MYPNNRETTNLKRNTYNFDVPALSYQLFYNYKLNQKRTNLSNFRWFRIKIFLKFKIFLLGKSSLL